MWHLGTSNVRLLLAAVVCWCVVVAAIALDGAEARTTTTTATQTQQRHPLNNNNNYVGVSEGSHRRYLQEDGGTTEDEDGDGTTEDTIGVILGKFKKPQKPPTKAPVPPPPVAPPPVIAPVVNSPVLPPAPVPVPPTPVMLTPAVVPVQSPPVVSPPVAAPPVTPPVVVPPVPTPFVPMPVPIRSPPPVTPPVVPPVPTPIVPMPVPIRSSPPVVGEPSVVYYDDDDTYLPYDDDSVPTNSNTRRPTLAPKAPSPVVVPVSPVVVPVSTPTGLPPVVPVPVRPPTLVAPPPNASPVTATATGSSGDCPMPSSTTSSEEAAAAPVPKPFGYFGVADCPDTPESSKTQRGYVFWQDLVHDINHFDPTSGSTTEDEIDLATIHIFKLCPYATYDATSYPTLHIQHSNIEIVCGSTGFPEGCVIEGSDIRIGTTDSSTLLNGIVLRGLEFVQQRSELSIGATSSVQIAHCRFSDSYFSGQVTTKRAAVVSAGQVHINDCLFANNIGQGAVLITGQTALVERSLFRFNQIAPSFQILQTEWDTCGSAIQVGYSNDTDVRNDNIYNNHTAVLTLRDSCFDNNYGSHIVRIQPGATLGSNRRNAVLNTEGNATCNGIFIYRRHDDTGIIDEACQRFAFRNVSCADRAMVMTAIPTSAPVVAPVSVPSAPIVSPPSSNASSTPPNSTDPDTDDGVDDDGDVDDSIPPLTTDDDDGDNELEGSGNSTDDGTVPVDDDDSTESTDDDSTEEGGEEEEEADDATWLQDIIETLEHNDTEDDAIVPLTDTYDFEPRSDASRWWSSDRTMGCYAYCLFSLLWVGTWILTWN